MASKLLDKITSYRDYRGIKGLQRKLKKTVTFLQYIYENVNMKCNFQKKTLIEVSKIGKINFYFFVYNLIDN